MSTRMLTLKRPIRPRIRSLTVGGVALRRLAAWPRFSSRASISSRRSLTTPGPGATVAPPPPMPLPPDRVDYLPDDRPAGHPVAGERPGGLLGRPQHRALRIPSAAGRGAQSRGLAARFPDVQQYSAHEYGNRVGFWRLLEVLDRYQIRCSTTLNVGVLAALPGDRRGDARARTWTFVNHGFYNTRYITTFSEEQEREFFERCRETFTRLTGRELRGQSGPAASNTERTPDVLAEVGFRYQTDWKIDDQPLPIKVRAGRGWCAFPTPRS